MQCRMRSVSDAVKGTIYELFHIACLKYPDNTAVIYDCETNVVIFKYSDLLTELEKLSECLHRFCHSHTYIGICIRTLHLAPTIILGILREGQAYVVIGEDEHATQVLRQLGCSWVVAEPGCQWLGPGPRELRARLQLHGLPLVLWEVRGVACLPRVAGVRLAYAVQTSGTTGPPTTVQVPHSAILPNIIDLRRLLQVTALDVVFLAAPLTFDPSVVEMFVALGSGAALLVAGASVRSSPRLLMHCLFPRAQGSPHGGVTVLQATPSVLGWWLGGAPLGPRLRVLLLGGEPCPPLGVLRCWTAGCPSCQVLCAYGLTELSCWASLQEVSWGDHVAGVPLGRPLSGTLMSVRDLAGQVVVDGEGELFVGSMERICFVGDEEIKVPTETVFRQTGDIVKVDGQSRDVLYVGRANRTAKRWGHRVDLATVEQAVCSWRTDVLCRCVWDQESRLLGLFLVAERAEEEGLASQVRWHLVHCLPPACLPDEVRVLQAWPLTAHGKVNEAALKGFLRESNEGSSSKQRRLSLEEALTRLWHKYLGPLPPAAGDTFSHGGGNSFVALQMSLELEKLCGGPAQADLVPLLLGGATFDECRRRMVALGAPTEHGPQSPSCSDSFLHEVKACETEGERDLNGDVATDERRESHGVEMLVAGREARHGPCEGSSGDRLCWTSCRGRTTSHCEPCRTRDVGRPGSRVALDVRWKSDLGKCVDASPAVAGYCSGRVLVLVGSHSHKLAAVDGETGRTAWHIDLPDRIESSVCISPCGTRGVVGRWWLVPTGCYDGSVYCLDLGSGKVCWRFPTGQMVKCSPTLCQDGSAIAVGSYDKHLYCLAIQDGAERWRVQLGGSVLASPVVQPGAGLVLAAALDGTCVAVAQDDGSCCWRRTLANPIFSSPTLLGADQVLFIEVSGLVHCLCPSTGKQVWSVKVGGHVFSSACMADDGAALIGCQDGGVYCVTGTGLVRWRTQLDSAVVAAPCCLPGTGLSVAASTAGKVYVLELLSGEVRCCQPLPHQVFSSPASCHRHRVYLGCRDNHLYCLALC